MPDPVLLDPTRAEPPAPRGTRRTRHLPDAGVACLAAAVACSGAYLLILQSHLTFFGDDWIFLLDRRGFSAGVFLDPHNGHIAVAPVAIYKALLALFGMQSALPFQIVSTLVFLLSAVLLFVYLRRRLGDWPALLGSVLILFLGAAATDLLWSFQIGLSGSIAAGIGALLALDRDDRGGDVLACALLVVSTSFSELGVPFAVGAFIRVFLGPSPVSRLYVALTPAVLYGIWYLGWGHTAGNTLSFQNFVNSPKFIFDAVSANLVSLLGLATPFTNKATPNIGGLGLGRFLLLIALGLAAWRVWRMRGPTHWLWAALAAGGAFWFLTALNAFVLRTPSSTRYQYPGAIFVLLIAAELLRGVRANKRVFVAATAVTVAAAVSGVIFLHDFYNLRRAASDDLRARLAAVEIGRGHEPRNLIISFHLLVPRPARSYFSAVDAFGSPALSEEQLARTDETGRAAADRQLVSAEGITLSAPPAGVGSGPRAAGDCHRLNGGSSGLALAPGRYVLSERKLPGAPQPDTAVLAARFADQPALDLGVLQPGARATISFPKDSSNRRWRLYSTLVGAVTFCNLRRP